MSERGVIIVGTGLITKFHAQAVNASSKLKLKGFVGRTKEKAAARAAEFGGEAFDDLDAAFSAPGVGPIFQRAPLFPKLRGYFA